MYRVKLHKKALKSIRKMPLQQQKKLKLLLLDIQREGPVQALRFIMLVHVKTSRIEFTVSGDRYDPLLEFLHKRFKDEEQEIRDEYIDLEDSPWFHSTKLRAGETLKNHRRNLKMSQKDLGERIGGRSKQYVSDLESGRRNITVKTAKLLAMALGHGYKAYL